MQKSSSGMVVLVGVGVNPSSPDRWPYWKIQTMAPKTALRLRKLRTRALSGSTTLPVNSHRTISVVRTIRTRASGSRLPRSCFWSTSDAAPPPT